jgi:hypothetical protein
MIYPRTSLTQPRISEIQRSDPNVLPFWWPQVRLVGQLLRPVWAAAHEQRQHAAAKHLVVGHGGRVPLPVPGGRAGSRGRESSIGGRMIANASEKQECASRQFVFPCLHGSYARKLLLSRCA